MYKQIIGLTLLCFAAVTYAQVHGWADCGSPLGELYELRIFSEDSNCLTTPCPIVRGQDYRIEVDVGARGHSYTLNFTTTVNMPIIGPVPIMQGDACDDPGVNCPIYPGDAFTFVEIINIPTAVPALTVNAITRVTDHNGAPAKCFEVPVVLR